MKLVFEHEDERSIFHEIPPDSLICLVSDFLRSIYCIENIYIHRWANGFSYYGTGFLNNGDVLSFEINDSVLYYALKSEKPIGFVEGCSLKKNKNTKQIRIDCL